MPHAFKGVQFLNASLFHRTITMADGDLLSVGQRSTMHTSHSYTSCIAAIIERRDKHLGRSLDLLGGGNHFHYLVEQISDVVSGILPLFAHPSVLGGAIDNREIKLVFRSIEREHQVKYHFIYLFGTAVGFVNLVHHHDGLQTYLQSLLQHKTRLRHRTFKSVDQ